ncbi:glycerol kinase [Alteromonadaceae bacterium Bs31]|nr:glycerol kinase [Alteromonadaceae bacterium Bs31]
MPTVIAIDQSTSATKALLIDEKGQCLGRASRIHQQIYPEPGWVEHDAEEIWQNLLAAVKELLSENANFIGELSAISITNQRETIVVFDKATGLPLHNAIVWQCRRSETLCAEHSASGFEEFIHSRTGLKLDPYFSASKLQWLVRNEPALNDRIQNGSALVGTIDAYLIYRLTKGKVFASDSTNASRTLLFDITNLQWDKELCAFWQIPLQALPEVRESSAEFGTSDIDGILGEALPITGVIGDSQASLFAQRCYKAGTAKVTFGTGSSVLLNIGEQAQLSNKGVLSALAWVLNGVPTYAFEGIIINSAATLNWLQNQLGLVSDINELIAFTAELENSGGVYLVPAFSGLGLPHWQASARAAIVGLSGHSDKRHIARAALESIAYQLKDALEAMQQESGVKVSSLLADGGPTKNALLMQFTADITQSQLKVSTATDCSALGAAMMGFFGLGVYSSLDSINSLQFEEQLYPPVMPPNEVSKFHTGWQTAVKQVLAGVHN